MTVRGIFIRLFILILLIALGPAIVSVGGQMIAEAFGCQVDLNRVIPCVIQGRDFGQAVYNLGFVIWYSYLTIPAGLGLLGVWAVAAVIAFIVRLGKSPPPSAKA